MNYALAWFLVAIAGQQYVGPISQSECQQAVQYLATSGIVCRQASAMSICPAPGMAGTYMACPVFDFPQVTIKK
jgi:hypothetical protein